MNRKLQDQAWAALTDTKRTGLPDDANAKAKAEPLSQKSAENCDNENLISIQGDMEDDYYCDRKECCHNGEGYLKPMQCDTVLCDKRAPKPIRWRAEVRDKYWFICDTLRIGYNLDVRDVIDNARYRHGNYFRTESEAKQAAEAVKTTLEQFHKDHQQ